MDLKSLSAAELVRICTEQSEAACWAEFIRRYHRPVALTVLRICRLRGQDSAGLADDLIQETYLRLCANGYKLLRNFVPSAECEDPMAALVRRVAANVCADHFRSRNAQKRGGLSHYEYAENATEDIFGDLGLGARQVERGALLGQVDRLLASAPPEIVPQRERLIFSLYFRQGMTARAIAAIPSLQLSTKGVESALYRVTRYLRSQFGREPSSQQPGAEAQV